MQTGLQQIVSDSLVLTRFFLVPRIVRSALGAVLQFYVVMIVIWAVLSWTDHSRGFLNDLYKVLDTVVSPYVDIFKRFIPPVGGVDFSPMVAVLVLQLVFRLL